MLPYFIKCSAKPVIPQNAYQICSQANQRLLVKENMMPIEYIAYFRVSTQRQGQSGLGLEAQRKATSQFCDASEAVVLNSYTEIESGKKADRTKLNAAIAECRQRDATLLIAKLDRLARNVHFISGLIESGVKFVAIDTPNADRFMLHVYAAMAEEEARRISDRTKRALAAAKARGVMLGENGKRLAKVNRDAADEFASSAGIVVAQLRTINRMSFRQIADHLNRSNLLQTQRGGKWHQATVHRLYHRHVNLSQIFDPLVKTLN